MKKAAAKKQPPAARAPPKRSKAVPVPGPAAAVKTASKGPPPGGWPMPKVPAYLDKATAERRWEWAQHQDPLDPVKRTYESALSSWQCCLDQDSNKQIWREVLSGVRPKSDLKFTYESGKMIPVAESVAAHQVLFGGKRAPLRVVSAAAGVAKLKGRVSYDGLRITAIVPTNPKKLGSGSFKKFALYKEGMTPDEFIAAGGTKADVKYDVEHGFIKLV